MKRMPLSTEKECIQNYLAEYIVSKDYKRVFSLIGTDAGMEKLLPYWVELVSAEKQKDVFILQTFLYPQWKLYPTNASYALYVEKPFDFIWLDFFGSAFEGDNWAATIQASRRLKEDGTLCVTSGHRNSLGGVYDYEAKFGLLDLDIKDCKTYINNGMKMSLFTLTANHD
jgi:hypothetical protein